MLRDMSTTEVGEHPLLDGLVDLAALFPPAAMPMPAALDGYLAATAGSRAALVGRFLCPASLLPELLAALDGRVDADSDVLLGLICDTGLDQVPRVVDAVCNEPRLVLALVEYPIGRAAGGVAAAIIEAVDVLPDVEGYLELPRDVGWRAALGVLADTAYGAKLRTGGATATAFPTDAEVAAFIDACVLEEVPFKCTAGLHSAVRHTDARTGFEHHGFLNLLVAASTAVQGGSRAETQRWVAERDESVLVRRLGRMDATDAVVARSFLVAFGSCDLDEPVADLVRLGLLDPA